MTNIIPFNNKTNFKNVIASTTDGQKRLYRVPKRVLPAISTPTKVRLFHLIRAFILFLWKHAFNVETLHLEIWKIRTTANSCYCFIDGLTRILNFMQHIKKAANSKFPPEKLFKIIWHKVELESFWFKSAALIRKYSISSVFQMIL